MNSMITASLVLLALDYLADDNIDSTWYDQVTKISDIVFRRFMDLLLWVKNEIASTLPTLWTRQNAY